MATVESDRQPLQAYANLEKASPAVELADDVSVEAAATMSDPPGLMRWRG
jgi:hypothetical protein